MDWNEKSALQWDWENHGLFGGAKEAGISGFGDGGSSSKSSTSASVDSSSKEGWKISGFSFEAVEGVPRRRIGPNKNEELARVEPLIGLKLGKRTYFENVSNGNNSASSNSPFPSTTALVKKARVSHQSVLNSRCQVEGCDIDLSGAKDYHRKHRVCEGHSKCPKVVVAGQERRFCQQCSRFHDLREFDQKKRSCRRRLSDHNARRRKPQPDLSFNSSGFSSSFYDDKRQLNFLINRAPFALTRPTASSTWETSCGFSITHSTKTTKAGGMDGQLQVPDSELPNAAPALPHDLDKLLPFNGTTAEVFTPGVEASAVPASDSDVGGPDLRRALSLLSTDFWVHPDNLVQSNLSQHVNATSYNDSAMQASNTTTMGHWQEQPSPLPHQAQVLPFELHNDSGGRYLEFPLSKFPHETSLFDPGQILSKPDGHFLEFKT